jgi:hypothetical protein
MNSSRSTVLILLCFSSTKVYPKVSGLSHNEITTITIRWEATRRVMEAKLTIVTHKIAIQVNLVTESCTTCSSRSRLPVRKLLDTLSYIIGITALFASTCSPRDVKQTPVYSKNASPKRKSEHGISVNKITNLILQLTKIRSARE